jgi:drug/metabolite transporter (DMT)-like permease
MSVAFALPAALAYGLADFAGGIAARPRPVLVVAAVMQAAGLVALLPALALLPGQWSVAAVGAGALAGVAGAAGLLLYLRGLAVGPMGVVAPLSAVVGAGLPLVLGMVGGERPGPVAWLAIAVALVAIVLATAGARGRAATGAGLALGLAAGVGFGLFFVGIDAAPADSGLVPLLVGRLVSVPVLALIVVARGRGGALRAPGLMVAGGVADALANALFLLAARTGELGVSAAVVSLYPVVVVLLARVVLHERLTGAQLASAGLALGASVLLAAG